MYICMYVHIHRYVIIIYVYWHDMYVSRYVWRAHLGKELLGERVGVVQQVDGGERGRGLLLRVALAGAHRALRKEKKFPS